MVLVLSLFSDLSHATNCLSVTSNSSIEIPAKTQHCLSLPLTTNEPLIIYQVESLKSPNSKFKVEVLSDNSSSPTVLESFNSTGLVAVNAALSTSRMDIANVRIKPVLGEGIVTSKIRIMFGNINGLDSLFIFNENIIESPTECVIESGQPDCEISGSSFLGFSNVTQNSSTHCNMNNSSPEMPSSFDLNNNLRIAENYKSLLENHIANIRAHGDAFEKRNIALLETPLKYAWAFNLMHDGHSLDVKAYFGKGDEFEDFGNFHYGAFLNAAGFSRSEILSGASFNQAWKDNGKNWGAAWEAFKGWFTQDQDHPNDTLQIERGIKYYDEVYKNDSTPTLKSDSCDPDNGLNKSSGGSNGGSPGSGSSGGGVGTRACYITTESWQVCTSGGCNYWTEQQIDCF